MPIEYRGSYPYWYYENVTLAAGGASLGPQYIVKSIKSGYDYWLRGILVSYPHYTHIAQPADVTPPIYLSLIQVERNRQITEIPIPVDIMSNPGISEPPPPGHNQHARPLHNGYIRFNYLISNKDIIKLKIEGQAGGYPLYARIAIVGNNVKAGNHV